MNLPPSLDILLRRTLTAYGLSPEQIDFYQQAAAVLGDQRGTLAVVRAVGQFFAVLLAPVLILPEFGDDFGLELIRITQAVDLYPGSSLTLQDGALYLAGCHPLSTQQERDADETLNLLWEMVLDTHERLREALARSRPGFPQPVPRMD